MKIYFLFLILHEIYSLRYGDTPESDEGTWVKIYKQDRIEQIPKDSNGRSMFIHCVLGDCNLGQEGYDSTRDGFPHDNFINFDHPFMSQLSEFQFMFLWHGCNGIDWFRWTQEDNPLSETDQNMYPTDISYGGNTNHLANPAIWTPPFTGLSRSDNPYVLLDGVVEVNNLGHPLNFYAVGATHRSECAPWGNAATVTELYVLNPDVVQVDPCLTDNGGCDDNASCTDNNGVAECACNSGYTRDGASCISFPCPSEECWTYANGRCVAIESCASVSCTDSGIAVTLNAALQFSLDAMSPTPVSETVTIGGSDVTGFTVSCAFFECGMTHTIENNQLTFTLPMEARGDVLTVGGVEILTSSLVSEGNFHCSYPIDVEVSSGSYEVSAPTAAPGTDAPTSWTGAVTNTPLANHITVAFSNTGTMGVGAAIETTFSLDFPASSGISFTLRSCQVQTGSTSVDIIDGGCYSQALSAQPLSFANGVLTISYEAFTSVAATERESQDLTCSIRLCMSTCTRPTGDDQCPTGGNAASYQYAAYYDVFTT